MPAFPTFSATNTVFRPFITRREWRNLHGDNEVGYRFSYNERSSAPLMEWTIESVVLSDADLGTLSAFWESVGGAYEDFTFTDPDTSVAYSKCRFIGDELTVQRLGPNENRVTVGWRELV